MFLNELFNRRAKKTDSLSHIHTLLASYGNPERGYPTIHVAGTNGKGQVTTKIAAGLQFAGYKTGRYISPHLFSYEERISINGKNIPIERVEAYYKELPNTEANFFECTTCFAFRYFQEEEVDFAVIETGLGGLYDATNVLIPKLSVITSISYDHKEILGETLEEIAYQKAGILKPSTPVVLGPTACLPIILNRAKELKAPVYAIEKREEYYELENRAVARKTLELLGINQEAIEKGLEANLPCRFERRGDLILDVAHNPAGFEKLVQALETFYPEEKFRFVVGISENKEIAECLREIEKHALHIHFVSIPYSRLAPVEELAHAWSQITKKPFSVEKGVAEAVRGAKASAKGEKIVICGSFFVMQEVVG